MNSEAKKQLKTYGLIIIVIFLYFQISSSFDYIKMGNFINSIDEILISEKAFFLNEDNIKYSITDENLNVLIEEMKYTHYFENKWWEITRNNYQIVASIIFVNSDQQEFTVEVLLFDKNILKVNVDDQLFIDEDYPVLLRLDGVLFQLEDNLLKYLNQWGVLDN